MVDSEVDESILMDCCSMEITILTNTIYFTYLLRLYHNLYFQKCHVMVSVNIKTLAGLRHIETSALHSILKIVSLCIKCNVVGIPHSSHEVSQLNSSSMGVMNGRGRIAPV